MVQGLISNRLHSVMVGMVILFSALITHVSSSSLEGHLKPLGLQRKSEGHIDVTEDIPDPKTFFEKYVKGSKPLVLKGAARKLPAFHLWTDEFLSKEFGHLSVDIEEGKKENRSLGAWTWPLKKFIEKYKKEDVYLVHTLQKEMWRDLRLLPCISCGGYSKVLQMLVLWFSSGGTKSVLHNDAIDNINCLFSGSKSLYMVDWKHHKHVDFDADGSHSNVNVDAVDLNKYPGLSEAPWWKADMEAGDCLFIPYLWIHQVRSSADETNRNMAVNVWFYHLQEINMSDCESATTFLPFDGMEISNSNIEAVRSLLLLQIGSNSEIKNKDMFKKLSQYYRSRGGVMKSELKDIRDILDKDKDRKISIAEINNLTVDELKIISIVFPGLYSEEEEPPAQQSEEEEEETLYSENDGLPGDDYDKTEKEKDEL